MFKTYCTLKTNKLNKTLSKPQISGALAASLVAFMTRVNVKSEPSKVHIEKPLLLINELRGLISNCVALRGFFNTNLFGRYKGKNTYFIFNTKCGIPESV